MATKKHRRQRRTKRSKTYNNRKTYNKNTYKKKSIYNLARGPKPMRPISATGPVECCMCGETGRRDNTLVPSACLTKHGERAHRICQDCWWNEFAIEGASHQCPGCVKHLPLTAPLKRTKPREEDIIVISDD
jgi:hypothetical protein